MSYPIKTSISSNEDIYDMNGQWLPKGNYYFSITRLTDDTAEGELYERTFQATYKFKTKDVVRMMSGAQARLARRANIAHLNMPSLASPTGSPANIPNEIIARRNIRSSPTNSTRRQLPQLTRVSRRLSNSITMCTICLEAINDDSTKRTLGCNHHFHENCINRWLVTRPHCPVCRRHVPGRRASRAMIQQRREIRNRYNIINNTNMNVRGTSRRISPYRSSNRSINQQATRQDVRERNRRRMGGRSSEYRRNYSSLPSLIS
tara:strand:+ start:142 stop:927 length:786 start_codon:yes stop_codon:yes gene_type:complete